jgi:hypothetical protein
MGHTWASWPIGRRALVLDRFRLEISTENGEFFVADASGGHVLLSIPGALVMG